MKRTGTATNYPLTIAGPVTASCKLPSLASIMLPNSAPTPPTPTSSPENWFAPGWCHTTSGLSWAIAIGTWPLPRASKQVAATSAGVF